MSFVARCVEEFDSRIRIQGERLFQQGRVATLVVSDELAKFVVQDNGDDQNVVLDWGFSREQLAVCCTCGYYKSSGLCKHIWAAILAADAQGIGPRWRAAAGRAADGPGGIRRRLDP